MNTDEERNAQPLGLRAVGDVLDEVLQAMAGGSQRPLMIIRQRWDDIAGPRWETRCRPVRVTEDVVVVEADDGATASLLRYELSHMEQRLRKLVPEAHVARVRVRVRAESGDSSVEH